MCATKCILTLLLFHLRQKYQNRIFGFSMIQQKERLEEKKLIFDVIAFLEALYHFGENRSKNV